MPFLGAGAVDDVGRISPRFHLSGYSYFVGPPLPPCGHPVEWVETGGVDMADFRGKGTPVRKFHSGFCMTLKDSIKVGQERIIGESTIATLLNDMTDGPAEMFPHHIDPPLNNCQLGYCFIYWLCNCLNNFEGILKMADYEIIWASRYKQQLDEELLKALIARWFPCTSIFLHAKGH